ncbi:hypothetical protein BYT27DRAFT_7176571 [Phlegmacium glaucopus]|nr:hypothetical protein BYT27DRAFT_7176571 [Phlegmacium glaucopus]
MTSGITIDSFPNELLAKVFQVGACLPMEVDQNYPRRLLFSKLPLYPLYPTTLTQVSRRWKDLALQMPVLWSFLHLSRSLQSHRRLKSELKRSLEWVPTYLSRSANLPLHITLDTTRIPVEAAVELLYPQSVRWCSLTLLVSHVGSLPCVLPPFVAIKIPQLQSLTITSDIYRDGIIVYDPIPHFFVHATHALSSICLNGVYLTWNAPPLINLLNLELRFASRWPSFSYLKKMIGASPMLRRLVIQDEIASILRNVGQDQEARPRVVLSHLEYLEIGVYRLREESYADVAGLMGLFEMPLLETLTLKELRYNEWRDVADKYRLPPNPSDFERPGLHHSVSPPTSLQDFPLLSSLTVTGFCTFN